MFTNETLNGLFTGRKYVITEAFIEKMHGPVSANFIGTVITVDKVYQYNGSGIYVQFRWPGNGMNVPLDALLDLIPVTPLRLPGGAVVMELPMEDECG